MKSEVFVYGKRGHMEKWSLSLFYRPYFKEEME